MCLCSIILYINLLYYNILYIYIYYIHTISIFISLANFCSTNGREKMFVDPPFDDMAVAVP